MQEEKVPIIRSGLRPLAVIFGVICLLVGIPVVAVPLSAMLFGENQQAIVLSSQDKPINSFNRTGDYEYTVRSTVDDTEYTIRNDRLQQPGSAVEIRVAPLGHSATLKSGSISNYDIRTGAVVSAFGLMWIALAFSKRKVPATATVKK